MDKKEKELESYKKLLTEIHEKEKSMTEKERELESYKLQEEEEVKKVGNKRELVGMFFGSILGGIIAAVLLRFVVIPYTPYFDNKVGLALLIFIILEIIFAYFVLRKPSWKKQIEKLKEINHRLDKYKKK